jgi:hypothetical protein
MYILCRVAAELEVFKKQNTDVYSMLYAGKYVYSICMLVCLYRFLMPVCLLPLPVANAHDFGNK